MSILEENSGPSLEVERDQAVSPYPGMLTASCLPLSKNSEPVERREKEQRERKAVLGGYQT
jgi:hypothetical protein